MSVSAHVRQPGGLDVLGEPAGLHLHTGPVVMFSTSRLTWARQCWQSVQTQCWSSLLARRRLQRRPSWGAGRAGRLAGSPVSPPHSARLEESPVWVEAVTLLAQLLHTVWQHSQHFTPPLQCSTVKHCTAENTTWSSQNLVLRQRAQTRLCSAASRTPSGIGKLWGNSLVSGAILCMFLSISLNKVGVPTAKVGRGRLCVFSAAAGCIERLVSQSHLQLGLAEDAADVLQLPEPQIHHRLHRLPGVAGPHLRQAGRGCAGPGQGVTPQQGGNGPGQTAGAQRHCNTWRVRISQY